MKNEDERIRLGDIHFFLRNISALKTTQAHRNTYADAAPDGPTPSDHANKVMLRVGRSFFRHVKQQNPDTTNDSMYESFTKMFQEFDTSGEGLLSQQELGKALNKMGVALSTNQALVLFEAVDADGNGHIEINEALAFLHFVEKRIAQRTHLGQQFYLHSGWGLVVSVLVGVR